MHIIGGGDPPTANTTAAIFRTRVKAERMLGSSDLLGTAVPHRDIAWAFS